MTQAVVPSPSSSPTAPELDPRRWIALASVLTSSFMVLLDVSIVNVAIPAIRNNLGANNADIQFVIAGYGLAYAVMLITGGRLGDIYGRKRLFLIGMLGFVLASASCGLAQGAVMLDISRVIQGLMASLMFPQTLSIIQVIFPPSERGRVFGLLGAVIGIATITGPLVGGLIIRDDLTGSSWRWIFLVNVPIGLVALAVAVRNVPESTAPHATGLDIVGFLLATVGMLLLVYPLVEGQTAGWPLWSFVCMGLSPLVLIGFVLYERTLPASKFPLVQLSMFGIPAFRVGVVVSMVLLAGVPAFFFTFSLMLQAGLGFSALHAGLTTVPWSLGTAIASGASSRFAPKLGKWTMTIAAVLLVLGMLGIIGTLHLRGVDVSSVDLIPSFFVAGLGLGTVIAPLLNLILAGVPPRHAGSASGVVTTFQQLGGALGVAVVGVVFFSLLSNNAASAAADVTPQLRQQLSHLMPPQAVDGAVAQFTNCFEAQAGASDPTAPVPGCPQPQPGAPLTPPQAAFRAAAQGALAHDFVDDLENVLFIVIGFWVLMGLLSLVFPPVRPAEHPGAAAAAA